MTDRAKALASLGLFTLVAFGLSWALTPWADTAAIVIVIAIAPAATGFALLYMLASPWWTTAIGRAMLISSTALALLVDIALIYQWLGDDYRFRDAVRLTVYLWICLGAWWKFGALVIQKVRDHRDRP